MQTITTLTINGSQYHLTDGVSRQATQQLQQQMEQQTQQMEQQLQQQTQQMQQQMEQQTRQMEQQLSEQSAAMEAWKQQTLAQLTKQAADNASPIVCAASGTDISVKDAADRKLLGLTLYGKTTQDGAPTPDAPIDMVSAGASGNIGVTITGKNLAKPRFGSAGTTNGIQYSIDEQGVASVSGTSASAGNNVYIMDYGIMHGKELMLPAGTYTASVHLLSGSVSGENVTISVTPLSTGKQTYSYMYISKSPNVKTLTLTEPAKVSLILQFGKGGVAADAKVALQIEAGTQATDWEPYIEQTLSIPTPNGLPGIPVTSDGNYTDQSGQPWVCDEIDLARGVYVQRVYRYELTGNENWGTANTVNDKYVHCSSNGYLPRAIYPSGKGDGYCTHLPYSYYDAYARTVNHIGVDVSGRIWVYTYLPLMDFVTLLKDNYAAGTPVLLYYCLETPVESALDADTLAAYASLHANKPNTGVFNDAGAGMSVSYVADTKTYVDHKFTELRNAILASGANI